MAKTQIKNKTKLRSFAIIIYCHANLSLKSQKKIYFVGRPNSTMGKKKNQRKTTLDAHLPNQIFKQEKCKTVKMFLRLQTSFMAGQNASIQMSLPLVTPRPNM